MDSPSALYRRSHPLAVKAAEPLITDCSRGRPRRGLDSGRCRCCADAAPQGARLGHHEPEPEL